MQDFSVMLDNKAMSETALNFEPLPEQRVLNAPRRVPSPVMKLGALVQPNGDVLFRMYAPTASRVEVEIHNLKRKLFEVENGFDPAILSSHSFTSYGQMLPLEKQENGCFEGTLKYTELVAGPRTVNFFVDGVLVLEPHVPVAYTGDRYTNFVEIPDPDFEDMLIKDVPHGALTYDVYWSSVMKNWVRQVVYTPPGYRQGADSYPVIYLEEGRSQVETNWAFEGKVPEIMDNLIAQGKAVPCIIVMNNGMHRTPEDGTEKYDGFIEMLCKDTIPFAEANYRVKADKWHRGFAGLSMGGMQATKGGLEHPELFAWLGWFSSAIRMRDVELDFDENHHLDVLRDHPELVEKEYKLIYRGNGIAEINRDKVVLDDNQWIVEHGVDKLSCYKRDIFYDCGGEHEWTTWRRCLRNFVQLTFR